MRSAIAALNYHQFNVRHVSLHLVILAPHYFIRFVDLLLFQRYSHKTCNPYIINNNYVTRFEKGHFPRTQQQDTLFTIKQ